ncbi:MAG: hypothetical protein WC756_12175 [Taibaiella sp.]|jgi:hypothetical protein
MSVKAGDRIAVWFSNGAASAVALKRTLELYGDICEVRVLNNPILEEDPDNRRFLKDVEKWLGVSAESVIHPKFPHCSCVKVWQKRKYMSGIEGAPCTMVLKKEARQIWESKNPHEWLVMGFTVEELQRHQDFKLTERDNILPVLINAGLTKEDCFEIIDQAGIRLPLSYLLGFANANCIGCVKATSPTYWNHVRKHYPKVFRARAKQSRKLGARLVRYKGKRIFLDELPKDAKGRDMKIFKMPECGLFCGEKIKR